MMSTQSSTPTVDAAIKKAIQACENAIERGIIVNDKIVFIQGYLKTNPLFFHFAFPVPAEWIRSEMEEE